MASDRVGAESPIRVLMILPRPRLHGLVIRLALFYALLAVPTLFIVKGAVLWFEFEGFKRGVETGNLDRALQDGARDLSEQWVHLRGADGTDVAALGMWLDAWILRLQQPRGGLTPDGSYVLPELADEPLAAVLFAPQGQELARSRDDGQWQPALPAPAERSRARSLEGNAVVPLPGDERSAFVRRVITPVRDASGTLLGTLFLELRLPPPRTRVLHAPMFESPTLVVFLLVFGAASSLFLARWVTRRLNRIAAAASAWRHGDFAGRIDDAARDELGVLSRQLDAMAVDLKGLLRARAQLATMAERQRLARDLHDTVKQKAFALNLQLATTRRELGEDAGGAALESAQRLTRQIQQELAQILDEMQAPDAELPFTERLRARAADWAGSATMALVTRIGEVAGLAPQSEEDLLRIVDEALSNVLRHSGASRVSLSLLEAEGVIRLVIADNGGSNFDGGGSGMGIGNMRRRALALPQGTFDFPGTGSDGAVLTVTLRGAGVDG